MLWKKLKQIECPFCNLKGDFEVKKEDECKYQVKCNGCGLGGPSSIGSNENAAKNGAIFEMLMFVKALEK
jgi:uncharacterized Zn finger protein